MPNRETSNLLHPSQFIFPQYINLKNTQLILKLNQ